MSEHKEYHLYMDIGRKDVLYIKIHLSMKEAMDDAKRLFKDMHILGDVIDSNLFWIWMSWGDFRANKKPIGKVRIK